MNEQVDKEVEKKEEEDMEENEGKSIKRKRSGRE